MQYRIVCTNSSVYGICTYKCVFTMAEAIATDPVSIKRHQRLLTPPKKNLEKKVLKIGKKIGLKMGSNPGHRSWSQGT